MKLIWAMTGPAAPKAIAPARADIAVTAVRLFLFIPEFSPATAQHRCLNSQGFRRNLNCR
tara:strand:- start:164 stop:343 length:180 start_codon:yes stop_codon:yes gene_type:complete